jgi:hypothetical protein
MNKLGWVSLGAAAVVLAACSDSTSAPDASSDVTTSSMASVYAAAPAGFSELSSSYNATGDEGAFLPDFDAHGHGRGWKKGGHDDDTRGPGFGLGLMGGGMGRFLLGEGIGSTHFLRFRSGKCSFVSDTGVVCADTTRHGSVVSGKTIRYVKADGTLQSSLDSATDTVAFVASVKGSTARRDSSTSSVEASSSQTIAGLLGDSRTVNGTSSGVETSTGNSLFGPFTAKRTTADTISGVVIPKATTKNTRLYPTAGTITRTMSATVEIQSATLTTTRKETITYDGSATAKVVIEKDGTVQNCTQPLPFGKLTCS